MGRTPSSAAGPLAGQFARADQGSACGPGGPPHKIEAWTIILYGSQARGEASSHSDVDLLVLFREVAEERGDNDVAAVERLLESGPWDVACYHCEQAAERYLKALLTLHGISAPLVHDVEYFHHALPARPG